MPAVVVPIAWRDTDDALLTSRAARKTVEVIPAFLRRTGRGDDRAHDATLVKTASTGKDERRARAGHDGRKGSCGSRLNDVPRRTPDDCKQHGGTAGENGQIVHDAASQAR